MKIHENAALLDAFVDGELTAAEMAEVQAHLAECPGCQAYVDDALAIRADFPTAESTELPADFTDHIMQAVAKTPQSRPKTQPWGKLAAAAACLAVIVLVQYGAGLSSRNTSNEAAAYTADCAAAESTVERSADASSGDDAYAARTHPPAMMQTAVSPWTPQTTVENPILSRQTVPSRRIKVKAQTAQLPSRALIRMGKAPSP